MHKMIGERAGFNDEQWDREFRRVPNLLITPHIVWRAADADTGETDRFLNDLCRHLAQKALRDVVDLGAGY